MSIEGAAPQGLAAAQGAVSVPEGRRQAAFDGRTVALFIGCVAVWALALATAQVAGTVSFVLLVLALVLHSSLTHEILHGIPFRSERVGTWVGLIQPGLAIPYLRFKRQHLAHHRDANLTDPYDDPESNYLDPAVWQALPAWRRAVLRVNNTLIGRMLIGPVVGQWSFMWQDWRAARNGAPHVARDWLLHVPGVVLVLAIVAFSPMSIWVYLAAAYCALCVLKIRTFLEHRAHDHACARTVVVEDRGLLSFLFLNNNFHVVHHMHPTVPWHQLPALFRAKKQRYLERNQGYVYRSYGSVFRKYLWRSKDPVPHPIWNPDTQPVEAAQPR